MTIRPSGSMPVVPWGAKTELATGGYLVTTMSGRADKEFVDALRPQMLAKVKPPDIVDWIADASLVESFDPKTLMQAASELLRDFKKQGGRFVVAIITKPTIRMAASTISFMSGAIGGAKVHIVDSMPHAIRELEQLRRRELELQRKAGRK